MSNHVQTTGLAVPFAALFAITAEFQVTACAKKILQCLRQGFVPTGFSLQMIKPHNAEHCFFFSRFLSVDF